MVIGRNILHARPPTPGTNRRALLATTGSGFAVAVAGCLGVTPPADDGHPLAGTEPTVRIDAERAAAITTAGERITEFDEIGAVQSREIAIALGFVQGFENEEPVMISTRTPQN